MNCTLQFNVSTKINLLTHEKENHFIRYQIFVGKVDEKNVFEFAIAIKYEKKEKKDRNLSVTNHKRSIQIQKMKIIQIVSLLILIN